MILLLQWETLNHSNPRLLQQGGEGKIIPLPPNLKLVKKLDVWYISTYTYVVPGNIPLSAKACFILLMSVFFFKKKNFFKQKWYLYAKAIVF